MFMTTQFLRAVVCAGMVLTIAATSPLAIARIHGTIMKIDPKRGTFTIHHDPFPVMPMAMTMEVEPTRRAELAKLHVGEVIDVTVDTTVVPWPGTNIRPAPARGRGK
jgi:Cu/Ag efflux protein CusF